MRHAFLPCLCLAAASLSAQNYAYLPATANPTGELSSYSLVPFMQPNARMQLFYDANEVASTGVANQVSLRFDGPIPQVGAPGPFTIQRLQIRVGVTTVATPGATFAANLSQPLTTAFDGPWTYYPDPGTAFPHPWGAPNNSLAFPFTNPVPVSIPAGGLLVIELVMDGNNIAQFGFSHAIVDGVRTTGGPQNGTAANYGTGCSAGSGPTATIGTTGTLAPGAAFFWNGQNLGANAPVFAFLGLMVWAYNSPNYLSETKGEPKGPPGGCCRRSRVSRRSRRAACRPRSRGRGFPRPSCH